MSSEAQAIRFSDVPKGRLVIWLLVAGEIVIFGGGVMAYLLNYFRHPEWAALGSAASFPLGALNTVVLLTSSVCIVLAHQAAVNKDVAKAKMMMWATIGLGLLFIVFKSMEWIPKIGSGIRLGDTAVMNSLGIGQSFWSYYYFLTGMHAVHVVLGMLAIGLVIKSISGGKNLHRVEMVGIYWHFVDIVWIFLFPLFYIV